MFEIILPTQGEIDGELAIIADEKPELAIAHQGVRAVAVVARIEIAGLDMGDAAADVATRTGAIDPKAREDGAAGACFVTGRALPIAVIAIERQFVAGKGAVKPRRPFFIAEQASWARSWIRLSDTGLNTPSGSLSLAMPTTTMSWSANSFFMALWNKRTGSSAASMFSVSVSIAAGLRIFKAPGHKVGSAATISKTTVREIINRVTSLGWSLEKRISPMPNLPSCIVSPSHIQNEDETKMPRPKTGRLQFSGGTPPRRKLSGWRAVPRWGYKRRIAREIRGRTGLGRALDLIEIGPIQQVSTVK